MPARCVSALLRSRGSRAYRTVDWGLTRQLLEHLGGTGQSVTRLSDGDVEDDLLDLQLPHGVGGLLGGVSHCEYAGVDGRWLS